MSNGLTLSPQDMMFDYSPLARRFKKNSDRWVGFACSFSLHIVLLIIGGIVLIKPIEFAVDSGLSGMEVQLIAGSSEVQEVIPVVPVEAPPEVQEPPPVAQEPEQVIEEVVKKEEPLPPPSVQKALGNSSINAAATQGAKTELQPSYLRNPAPRYPLEARRNKWEGTALLNVSVDKDGHSSKVNVLQSSGYDILDNAAVKTVGEWKFRPAKMGNMAVESSVQVPIRFEIEKER